jgi:hypothetical protein
LNTYRVSEDPNTVTLRLKRSFMPDEWTVAWYQGRNYDEDKSYYTPDRQDALDTLRSMENEAIRAGYKVVIEDRGR